MASTEVSSYQVPDWFRKQQGSSGKAPSTNRLRILSEKGLRTPGPDYEALGAQKFADAAKNFESSYGNDAYAHHQYTTPYAGGLDENGEEKREHFVDSDGQPMEVDLEENDGDVEEAISEEELKEHEELLKQGTNNVHGARGVDEDRDIPYEVAEMIQKASWVYRAAWMQGKHSSLVNTVREVNRVLKEDGFENFGMDLHLFDIIVTVGKALNLWFDADQKSNTVERQTHAKHLFKTIYAAKFPLYNMGLNWKSIVHPELAEALWNASQEGKALIEPQMSEIIEAWLNGDARSTSSLQDHVLVSAPKYIDEFFGNLEKQRSTKRCITELQKIRSELCAMNKSVSFKEKDYDLDLTFLINLADQYRNTSHDERAQFLKEAKIRFYQYLFTTGHARMIERTKSLEFRDSSWSGKQADDRFEERSIPVDLSADSVHYGISPGSKAGPPGTHATGDEPESPQHTPVNASGPDPKTATPASSLPNSQRYTPTASAGPEASVETQNHPTSNSTPGVTPVTGFKSHPIRGPMIDDRTTEYGYVLGGRRVGLGSRHILNVGTKDHPVYKTFRGSDFGRGSGAEMIEKYPLTMTKNISERRAKHLACVHSVVEVDSKSTSRHPITYFPVTWKDKEGVVEWITRSDLLKVCGQKWLDKKGAVLIKNWRSDLEYLEKMKLESLHPDTGRPLVESDRREMPWLFPDTQSEKQPATSREQGDQRDEEMNDPDDDNTDHIRVEPRTWGNRGNHGAQS